MRTIEDINEKIRKGNVLVLSASEVKELAQKESIKEIARKVDVVTTGTFSPMCSSGLFLNLGHTDPPLKMQKVLIDGVPAYGGLAAVDIYLGATESRPDNPRYGGAHVIHKLVKGERVEIEASGEPTHCYPKESIKGTFSLDQINQAYLFNPRNCYQNYNAAINSSDKILQTYMGVLKPGIESINYSGVGEISPLMNDPHLRTIGIGTPIFCCGGIGYISWEGTQYNKDQDKDPVTGIPVGPAATLAIIADLNEMKPEFIKPVVVPGYGISIYIAIGIAIPVLDEDIAHRVCIRNKNIKTRIIDYATRKSIGTVDYQDLIENNVTINGKSVNTRTMSDMKTSKRITEILKQWISSGQFELVAPVKSLPINGMLKKFPSTSQVKN